MNDLVLTLIHGSFCLYFFFFWDVTRRQIIRLGFLLDLFICLFFLQFYLFFYVNSDLLKKNEKGKLCCQNGLIFCRVVP